MKKIVLILFLVLMATTGYGGDITWYNGLGSLEEPTLTGSYGGTITNSAYGWVLTGTSDATITNTLAAGDKAINYSITQNSTALTGNLIGLAMVATNGATRAPNGVIYGAEIKARAATSGYVGNTIGRLDGVYVSVDAKKDTATTMRAFEASLDGGAGGMTTEAVAFEAFNNSSATQTASYAFSANGGTASGHKVYTADFRMQNGALFDNAVDGVLEINEASDEFKLTFGSNTITASSSDVTLFDFGTIDLATDALDLSEGDITNGGVASFDQVQADASALVIGAGTETVAVNSSDWDVSTGGAMSGIESITLDSGAKIFSGTAANGDSVYAEVGTVDAIGSIYLNTTNGYLYIQVANDGAASDWFKVNATDAD